MNSRGGAHILLGFYVNENLERTAADAKKLAEWISENPILDGIEIASEARFYSGIDWWDTIIDREEEEVEESEDSDSSDDDGSSLDSGEESETCSEGEDVRT